MAAMASASSISVMGGIFTIGHTTENKRQEQRRAGWALTAPLILLTCTEGAGCFLKGSAIMVLSMCKRLVGIQKKTSLPFSPQGISLIRASG